MIGHVAPGTAVHRFGAAGRRRDLGHRHDRRRRARAWRWRRGRLADPSGFLLDRYRLPQPRVGLALAGIASAGMDVSDGLVQDLGHICRASGLAAEIDGRPCAAVAMPLGRPGRSGWRPA